jgi:PAS domain S-box-containing protein
MKDGPNCPERDRLKTKDPGKRPMPETFPAPDIKSRNDFSGFAAYQDAGQALNENNDKYRLIFETDQAVKMIINPDDGCVVEANQAACRFYGYTKKEMTTKNLLDMTTLSAQELRERIKRVVDKRQFFFSSRHRLSSGEVRDVEIYAEPALIQGKIFLSSTIQDVTKRRHAEKALKESEENFRLLVENAREAILVIQDSEVKFVNAVAPKVLGLRPRQIQGDIADLVHPDDRQMVKERYYKRLRGFKVPERYVFRTLDQKGKTRWLSVKAMITQWQGRTATMAFLQNITQSKLAQEALILSEEKLAQTLQAGPVWVILTTLKEGRLLEANDSLLNALGYGRNEVMGKNLWELGIWDPNHRAQAIEQIFAKGIVMNEEGTFYTRWGEAKEVICSSVKLEADEEDCMLSVAVDITKRKRAEKALKESEERFRLAFENANIGMALVGLDGRFLLVNGQLCQMLGYDQTELQSLSFFQITHPQDKSLGQDLFKNMLKGRSQYARLEKRYLHKQGGIVWVQVAASLVRDSDHNPLYVVAHLQNITERKKAEMKLRMREQELSQKAKELEDTNTALEVLLHKRDKDIVNIKGKVSTNVTKLIKPYVEKLKFEVQASHHKNLLEIVERNLNEIVSPLAQALSSKYQGFTTNEIRVADLVMEGKTSKEIAEILNVSTKTVEYYRDNIRHKLGIKNKKINLRTYLLTFTKKVTS